MGALDTADAADTAAAVRTVQRLEPLHSMIYFVPESAEELGALGLDDQRLQYFGQRAAPMGAVGPGVVAATFYNFNPALIARSVPRVWSIAAPGDVVNARLRAADRALRRLLGDAVSSAAMTESATLARRACEGATVEDRPLYAAHADLPWPDEPHLMLWHAVTLLREHRGDGHLHALLGAGLSGLEALITHTATGKGFRPEFAVRSRGWSPEQWAEASAGLVERGLLTGDGGLTDEGAALRAAIEDETARTSMGPWRHLGAEGTARLAEASGPLSKAVLPAFAIEGVFAPGSPRAVAG